MTADEDQTGTHGCMPSYNHAAIYETSAVTLTSVNASNNRNLQGIKARGALLSHP